jgi:ABC-type lipoprotein release transport system permease subunit
MMSQQEGSYDLMIKNMVGSFTGPMQIQSPAYRTEPLLDHSLAIRSSWLDSVGAIESVSGLSPRIQQFALFSFGRKTRGGMLLGIEEETELPGLRLSDKNTKGENLSADRQDIVLAEGLAENLGAQIGDSSVILSQGYRGQSANGLYHLSGTVFFPSPELNRSMAFVELEEAQWLFGAQGLATMVVLHTDDPSRLEKKAAQIRAELDTSAFGVFTWREIMPELVQTIEADRQGGKLMLYVLYVIIGFGLFGTVLMMTAERTREFGMLIALGMKRSQLMLLTILESVFLSLIGVLLGLIAVYPLLLYFYFNPIQMTGQMAETMESYGMEPLLPTSLDPSILLEQALVILLFAILSALYPAWKIRRIQPVEAMRK